MKTSQQRSDKYPLREIVSEALEILGPDVKAIVFYQLEQRGYPFLGDEEYNIEQIILELYDIIGDTGGRIIGDSLRKLWINAS